MNFNLVEMYNGLLRFNKHILNELAEGLKHLPNLDGVSKGDSLIINEQGNPAWGSTAFIPTFENAAYGIEWTKDDNDIIRIGNAKFHRELLIKLLNSIVDYTNNTELEQELAQLQQKYNELVTNINKVEKLANETKTHHNSLYSDVNNTLKPKINSIDERVTALENSSQS